MRRCEAFVAGQEQSLVLALLMELHSVNLAHVSEGVVSTNDLGHVSIKIMPLGLRFAERFIEGKAPLRV